MKAPRKLDEPGLWEYAVKALAGRAHSTGELREKLRRRALSPEDVDATLARLKDYGYLDDRAFAESFAAARLENQRFGKTRVLRDLRQHRVAPSLAEGAVRKLYQNVDEEKLVEEYLRRRVRAPVLQDEKELAAAYRRLLRAGFAPGTVIRVLKRAARNPELLDAFEPPEPGEEE